MSAIDRKIKRNQLKKKLGTNKIREVWHEENETLEQKMKRIKKEKSK